LKLTILGCNGAIPAYGRYPTSQILDCGAEMFLIDCGEGAQMQMQKFGIKSSRINHVFISHLHGDHYYGLIGWLNSQGLLGRVKVLHIYCAEKLKAIIDIQLDYALPYQIHYHFLKPNTSEILFDNNKYEVISFPVIHSLPTHGFRITFKRNKRTILPTATSKYQIPLYYMDKLTQGLDYTTQDGTVIKNEWLTEAGKPNLVYAYCADTIYTETILPFITNCNTLYHETTYTNNDIEKATARFHTTAAQAATLALLANAQQLIIGHYSSKYIDPETVWHEAKTIFDNCEYALEGKSFEVE
jgi:ribonuclease Z